MLNAIFQASQLIAKFRTSSLLQLVQIQIRTCEKIPFSNIMIQANSGHIVQAFPLFCSSCFSETHDAQIVFDALNDMFQLPVFDTTLNFGPIEVKWTPVTDATYTHGSFPCCVQSKKEIIRRSHYNAHFMFKKN